MRILVAGAEGRTGRHVVEQARGHGHDVTALAAPGDRAALAEILREQDAVVSTLAVDGVAWDATAQDVSADLVRVMSATGIERLVLASWAGAGGHARELPLVRRAALLLPAARERLAVADLIEGDVMLSDLDWTIVRACGPTDQARTGHYRVVEGPVVPKGAGVPRGDLAALLLKTAESGRYSRRIVAVARGQTSPERGTSLHRSSMLE